MIAVADYGVGNLASVKKAFAAVGAEAELVADPDALARADAIVLPGVGNFGHCAREFRRRGLDAPLREAHQRDVPILGICVGMQLLFEGSEEDEGAGGLGFFRGQVTKMRGTPRLPQIGWNSVRLRRRHPWLRDVDDGDYFYFVHSFVPAARKLVADVAEWLHIVDLDGSRTGAPANLDQNRTIANRFTVKIQAGGGIRDFDTAEAFAEAGATRIVVGTAAISDPELIGRLVDRHADGLAVSVDARSGMVTTQGWTATSEVRAVDLMQQLAVVGVPTVIYTNVSVDGTLQGVDLASTEAVARAFGGDVI